MTGLSVVITSLYSTHSAFSPLKLYFYKYFPPKRVGYFYKIKRLIDKLFSTLPDASPSHSLIIFKENFI